MSDKKYKKEDCILLLQNKYKELQAGILRGIAELRSSSMLSLSST